MNRKISPTHTKKNRCTSAVAPALARETTMWTIDIVTQEPSRMFQDDSRQRAGTWCESSSTAIQSHYGLFKTLLTYRPKVLVIQCESKISLIYISVQFSFLVFHNNDKSLQLTSKPNLKKHLYHKDGRQHITGHILDVSHQKGRVRSSYNLHVWSITFSQTHFTHLFHKL